MSAPIPADQRRVHIAAMLAAACMMAHQLAGKAARDGFFLAQFPATQLPKAVAAAALLSVVLALWSPRILRRWGPARTIPIAFACSGLLHASEWFVRNAWPRFTAAFVYLHIVGFGAVLLSGFWLLLSELFDPHEAKRRFGKVVGAGTAGGVLGGIAAERAVEWFGPASLLLLLAGLHLCCATLIGRMRPVAPHAATEAPLETTLTGAFRRRLPCCRDSHCWYFSLPARPPCWTTSSNPEPLKHSAAGPLCSAISPSITPPVNS